MFQKTLCRKNCYEFFTKYWSGAGACIFKIVRMYLKTHFLLISQI